MARSPTDPPTSPAPLPEDFKEFLKLLNENGVEYLLVGGHAVGIYGYVRYTADLDVWIAASPSNSRRVVSALRKFGFDLPSSSADLFNQQHKIIRMGVPPLRIEIHTGISGVEFTPCFARREVMRIDNLEVPVITLGDLKTNKAAAGRLKDKLDLENLNRD